MKTYLATIKKIQAALLAISVGILAILPLVTIFRPDTISATAMQSLFAVSHWFLFFVMMVRPLADIFTNTNKIRPLVILRKGTGVLSASIIVSFILAKLIIDPTGYLSSYFILEYWSLVNFAVLAHVADISAILLLVTSNNFSKRLLGSWWKKIQKLSYVYFYGSALFVFFAYGNIELLIAMILVTGVTIAAFIKNKQRAAALSLEPKFQTS